MKHIKEIALIFAIIFLICGCSTVKHFTPDNQEFNAESIANYHSSTVNLIVNDLRSENADQTRNVIERILLSNFDLFYDSYKDENIVITVDIIEHRAFFRFSMWNAETILNISIKSENNMLYETKIEETDRAWNMWGYRTGIEVEQRTFDRAMNELLGILENTRI